MTCCDHGYGRPSWRPWASAPATYRSGTPRSQPPAVTRWHAHLRGLATVIHEISGLGFRFYSSLICLRKAETLGTAIWKRLCTYLRIDRKLEGWDISGVRSRRMASLCLLPSFRAGSQFRIAHFALQIIRSFPKNSLETRATGKLLHNGHDSQHLLARFRFSEHHIFMQTLARLRE